MKIKSITLTVTRVLQTAPYESAKVELTHTAELEPKDDVEKVEYEMYKALTRSIKKYATNEQAKYEKPKK